MLLQCCLLRRHRLGQRRALRYCSSWSFKNPIGTCPIYECAYAMLHESRYPVCLRGDRRVFAGSLFPLRPSKPIISCKQGHIEHGDDVQATTFSFTMKGNADSFLLPSFLRDDRRAPLRRLWGRCADCGRPGVYVQTFYLVSKTFS